MGARGEDARHSDDKDGRRRGSQDRDCASSDEMAIQMGLQVVNDTLANNYIRPDKSTKAQSKVKEESRYTFIDKIEVPFGRTRCIGPRSSTSAITTCTSPTTTCVRFDRLLTGAIWAQIDMRFEYDVETKGKHPFWIDKLTPIQLATFDLDEYRPRLIVFAPDQSSCRLRRRSQRFPITMKGFDVAMAQI